MVDAGLVLHRGSTPCVETVVSDASVSECGAESATCGLAR